jgi:hypothetical protein
VMFVVMSLMCVPVAVLTTSSPRDWLVAYQTVPTAGFLALLIGFSTLGGYLLMNRWQRHVSATEAGLIYCCEPVFASLLALVLPAWFSLWAGIDYANERLTFSLLLGGGLITLANVLLQLPPLAPPAAPASVTPAPDLPGDAMVGTRGQRDGARDPSFLPQRFLPDPCPRRCQCVGARPGRPSLSNQA